MAKGAKHKLKNGLTPKQNAFTKIILKQIAETGETNGTEAAKAVYDTTDSAVANQIASDNLRKPIIKETIEEALNAKGGNLEQFAEGLMHYANARPEKISAEVGFKANLEAIKLLTRLTKGTRLTQKTETVSFDDAKSSFTKVTQEATTFFSDAS